MFLRVRNSTLKQPAAEGKNTKFVVWGDNRPNVNLELNKLVMGENPDFIIHTGDLVQNGKELKDWYKFFSDFKNLVGEYYWLAVYGNHEQQAYLNKFFQLPENNSPDPDDEGHWFSLDYKNIHIIGLDVYRDFKDGSEQRQWLINDLSSINPDIDFVIAAFHEPPFSSGKYEDNVDVRDELIPLLDKFNVDLIFCGHDHIYERSVKGNLPIVITGGAGSELYEITPGKNPYSIYSESTYHYCRVTVIDDYLKVEMVRADGSIGDNFELDKGTTNPSLNEYFLAQNFPNPFNSTTTIAYNIPDARDIKLTVYDILGRKIKILVDENQTPGYYEIKFNAGICQAEYTSMSLTQVFLIL